MIKRVKQVQSRQQSRLSTTFLLPSEISSPSEDTNISVPQCHLFLHIVSRTMPRPCFPVPLARTRMAAPRVSWRRHYASSSSAKPSLNIPSTSGGPQAPQDYCASLVKRLDPEAWLCSYFWPRRERNWWLAWRAFNVGPNDRIRC